MNAFDEYEDFLNDIVGDVKCQEMGFDPLLAVIVGYREGFPLSKIDLSKEFIIESERELFIKRMNEKYPGESYPIFLGRIRDNIFLPLEDNKIVFVGQ